jgi:hypothetical protein
VHADELGATGDLDHGRGQVFAVARDVDVEEVLPVRHHQDVLHAVPGIVRGPNANEHGLAVVVLHTPHGAVGAVEYEVARAVVREQRAHLPRLDVHRVEVAPVLAVVGCEEERTAFLVEGQGGDVVERRRLHVTQAPRFVHRR